MVDFLYSKKNMKNKKKILVVGYGNFGKLICGMFKEKFETYAYIRSNKRPKTGIKKLKKIEDAQDMDFVVFAVPVQFLEESVKEFKPYIKEKTVIFDVASVKVYPVKILKKHFPNNEVLATHPLWGPESIKQQFKDLIVVLSNVSAKPKTVSKVSQYIKSLGFKVEKMTAEKHDKDMATIQGLSHFIGFALKKFHLKENHKLKTFAYREMIKLYQNAKNDSEELFKTIQNYNPYTKRIRKDFIKEILKIDKNLK